MRLEPMIAARGCSAPRSPRAPEREAAGLRPPDPCLLDSRCPVAFRDALVRLEPAFALAPRDLAAVSPAGVAPPVLAPSVLPPPFLPPSGWALLAFPLVFFRGCCAMRFLCLRCDRVDGCARSDGRASAW